MLHSDTAAPSLVPYPYRDGLGGYDAKGLLVVHPGERVEEVELKGAWGCMGVRRRGCEGV